MWIVPFTPCTSSPAPAGESSPTSSPACNPSARSKSRNTRNESSSTASPASQSGTTCRHSAPTIQTAPTPSDGSANIEPRSLSREVSRAKTSARRAVERDSPASALASGGSLPESFARFDRASCSWRIPQCLFQGDWSAFLGTWPRAGMMRSGECWRLAMLERDTNGSGCGLPPPPASSYPTPQAHDAVAGTSRPHGWGAQRNLTDLAAGMQYPTPRAHDRLPGGANLK